MLGDIHPSPGKRSDRYQCTTSGDQSNQFCTRKQLAIHDRMPAL
jgi:hypothetical protein